MGKILLIKVKIYLRKFLKALAESGKAASYAFITKIKIVLIRRERNKKTTLGRA